MKTFFSNIFSAVTTSLLPTPATFIVLALVFTLGALGGWKVNGWRLGNKLSTLEKNIATADEKAEVEKGKQAVYISNKVQEALNEARKRQQALRADVGRATSSVGWLRSELARQRQQMPSLTKDACMERADTRAELLGACVGRYQQLAAEADRHVSDKVMMKDAWPEYVPGSGW